MLGTLSIDFCEALHNHRPDGVDYFKWANVVSQARSYVIGDTSRPLRAHDRLPITEPNVVISYKFSFKKLRDETSHYHITTPEKAVRVRPSYC